ncbi:hypothetical protein B0H14DRAFT_3690784 [Mycena olivaceomarginata]|nr:hypothetical protein B0H14DRAFT_3690784 [Mycena olivaceomarginata]
MKACFLTVTCLDMHWADESPWSGMAFVYRLLWVDEIRKREPRPFTGNNIIEARRSKELTRNTSNNYWRRNDERVTKAGDVLQRSVADNAIHGRNSSEKKCRFDVPFGGGCGIGEVYGRLEAAGALDIMSDCSKQNGGSDKDKSGSGAERLPSACLGPATGRSCEERAHPKLSIAYRLIQLERASAARVLGVFDPGTLFVGRGGFPLVLWGGRCGIRRSFQGRASASLR